MGMEHIAEMIGQLGAVAMASSARQNKQDMARLMALVHLSTCRRCLRHDDNQARWCRYGRRLMREYQNLAPDSPSLKIEAGQ